MAEEDILAAAASATQGMIPQQGPLTGFMPEAPKVSLPPTFQPPELKQASGEFATSGGRKRADRQALIANTVNLVKSGADYIQAQKQRKLSMSIERLISAQEGLSEAQASGDQEAIARNSAIINDITSDPKMIKQLQKAFNIDLFGNGKNKAENQAMQEAFKNYAKEKQSNPNALNPVAKRLMESQPMRQQLSPEAQAQAAAIKAGLIPRAGDVLKTSFENFKTIMAAKTSEERTAALDREAQLRAEAVHYHADKIYDAQLERVLGAKAAAEIRERSEKYRADSVAATWDKRLAKMDEWTKLKTGSSQIFKSLYNEANTYNTQLKTLSAENAKLQAELDKPSSSTVGKLFGQKAISSGDAQTNRIKIKTNILQMKMIQQQLDSVTKKMSTLNQMGVINFAELGQGNSGGSEDSADEGDDSTEVPDTEVPE